ncbi:hypothetical protein B296_00033878, partial [Ensete ventricosum]
KRFLMGETLKGDSYLDIEAELSLADMKKRELRAEDATEEAEKLAMKELGIKRFDPYLCSSSLLSDSLCVVVVVQDDRQRAHRLREGDDHMLLWRSRYHHGCGSFSPRNKASAHVPISNPHILFFFFGYYRSETNLMMQVPGDMVVNAMMATMAAHAKQQAEFIYHMGSSVRNPVSYATLEHCGFRYFLANPRVRRDGSVIQTRRLPFIKSMVGFRVFMTLRYKLPLEVSPYTHICTNLPYAS